MGLRFSIGARAARYAFLLLFVTAVTPAFAWDITAVRDSTGALAFCRAEVKDNDSPLTLTIALSPSGEVNLGVKVPDAGFTKGEGYDVKLAIDDAWQKKATAETALPELLLIRLGKAPDFMAALGKGKNFVMTSDADATTFALNGSTAALATLQKCVTSKDAPPPADYQSTNDLQPARLPDGLAALLNEAHIDAQAVPLPDAPGRMVDYAWTAVVAGEKIDGGLLEKKVDDKSTLDKLIDAQVARYEKQCKVKTSPQRGKVEHYKIIDVELASMRCGTETGAFVFYKTDTNLFTVLIHRSLEKDAKGAFAAQKAVADVVRRLAKDSGGKP